MSVALTLLRSPIVAAMIGLAIGGAWGLGVHGPEREAYGRAVVRAEWAQATEDARRITDAALRAAEADKAALREQLAGARAAAQRARGGVERIDADGAAALGAIR